MWPDLPKGVLYMHIFKTHFSLPFDSYTNRPTAHMLNLLKVDQPAFTQTSFSSMSDNECLGGLQNGYFLP